MTESPVLLAILASLGSGAFSTALGALPVFFISGITERRQALMLGFGAGVMLAASFFSLLNPALEISLDRSSQGVALVVVITGFLTGGLLLSMANRFLPHEHFFTGVEGANPGRLRRIWLFVIAITIHNFPEGLSVGVDVGSSGLAGGLPITLGIGLQNMPEGLVVALALALQGYRRSTAFGVAALSGFVEPVGAGIGAAVVAFSQLTLPWMLALAAGAMIYVISDEIIPETHRDGFRREATASLMAGFVVMMSLEAALN